MKKKEFTTRQKVALENLRRLWYTKKQEMGLTQEKMAQMLGFSNQSGFGRFVNGREALYTDLIVDIAKIFKVSVKEIDPEFEIPPVNNYALEAFSELNQEEQREALEYIAFKRLKARSSADLEVAVAREGK
jgi:plasmid maintenance system antidote protein VapI